MTGQFSFFFDNMPINNFYRMKNRGGHAHSDELSSRLVSEIAAVPFREGAPRGTSESPEVPRWPSVQIM